MLVAQVAVFFQGFVDDRFELRRKLGVEAEWRSGIIVKDGVEQERGGGAVKWQSAGGHFVEHGTEGEDIAAPIEFLAPRLFRRHIGNGADGGAGAGKVVDARSLGDLRVGKAGAAGGHFGEAEIEDLGVAALADENVGGLNVAVNNALVVGGIERVGDFDGQGKKFVEFHRLAADAVLQGHAIEVLHGDEGPAFMFANVVNGADVGVVQGGSGLSFALKPGQRIAIAGDLFGQELQGHEAAQAGVFGFVDNAHSAAAQLFNDAVVRNCLTDHEERKLVASHSRDAGRGSQGRWHGRMSLRLC
ncbi:MAG TPA: hypothetical protein VLY24_06805 [Bryobacteraceae bacterium]|nr:hypothetical protein [Bryobacteraceae bacterium]